MKLIRYFDLIEQRCHRLADFGADRVARFGPVEREQRDVAAPFECHEFAHENDPNRRARRSPR